MFYRRDMMISTEYFIFIGIVLFLLGIALFYYDKEKNTHYLVNAFLLSSWVSAAIFAIHIFSLINANKAGEAIALSPLGMMIAALIASASVMKNIAETKAHDLSKSEKEKERKRVFVLNVMITIHTTIDVFINKYSDGQDEMSHSALVENSQVIQKMLDLIYIDDVLPYLNENHQNLLSNIYTQYCDFTVKYIHKSPETNHVIWPFYALDRYNHFKIFSEEYIELSKLQ